MDKKEARHRRSVKSRAMFKRLGKTRLCIHRTPRHIYAQIISTEGGLIIASASTVEKTVKELLAGYSGNKDAAEVVGKLVAQRAVDKGVKEVAFDRSGFKYHGRVKALADAARKNGLNF